MEEDTIKVSRAEIQEKIQELIKINDDPIEVKNKVDEWLKEMGYSNFWRNHILNDLTSYKEYLELSK